MTGGRSWHEGSAMITLGTILVVEDALAAFQAEQLELALVDSYLPGMNSWAVLEAVRAQQLDVPAVIMTTSGFSDADLAAADACLYQPFDLDDLLVCVTQHIRRR
jgi:DNA-binding response OmpR family regulator